MTVDSLPSVSGTPPASYRHRHPWAIAALILVAATACLWRALAAGPTERLLRQAELSLTAGKYDHALGIAVSVLDEAPDCSRALLIAGKAEAKLFHDERSLEFFQRVPDNEGLLSAQALYGSGDRLILLARAAEAEVCLRRSLEHDPNNVQARARLIHLLQSEGRIWESLPYLRSMVRRGRFHRTHLIMLGSAEGLHLNNSQFVNDCQAAVPDDPTPLIGRVRSLFTPDQRPQAEALLRKVLAAAPNQFEAQALLGQVLLDSSATDAVVLWNEALPPDAGSHPGIWAVRGRWAKRQGQVPAAARCLRESLLLDPNNGGVNYQMAEVLRQLGKADQAQAFADRARRLSELENRIVTNREGPDAMREIAGLLESLGRNWEAAAWLDIVFRLRPDLKWPREELYRLRGKLIKDSGSGAMANLSEMDNPARRIDLSSYPLPAWPTGVAEHRVAEDTQSSGHVAFTDVAESVGLKFSYYNGADPAAGRAYMFEFSGGGAAVLDFDGDGWPDLYLTQGCRWPVAKDATEHQNRLYRNTGDGYFEDVTVQSGLGDTQFGQGATVGDFNNDGFPDVYIANIGSNRMYENNGDGTFRDITAQTGTAGDHWTTSCLLADLNGDTWPDLYAVNYLAGPEVFERACEHQGIPEQCAPSMFRAEQDRLYLSLGDGRFEDCTERCGVVAENGKGLGVLAADFHGTRQLSLFVANDTTANFFFVNQSQPSDPRPRFLESALPTGLAYDELGRSQACMGIAADDVNGDGLPDLFVTNFYGEFNTLYASGMDGAFADFTRQAKLDTLSFDSLGFGTQFLDFELDGQPDLVVANGHVNDFTSQAIPYKMSPSAYRNIGGCQFAKIPTPSLGPYFEGEYLGRAVVRFDWNRDGLEDFCTTHVDAPVALLTNQTKSAGHYLAVRLRGTRSSRDAIGTVVRLVTATRTQSRQLTAGDGFEASNQRQLTFGLGEETSVQELVVRWPSGLDQSFRDIAADREIVLVEGSPTIWRLNASNAGH